MRRVSATLFGLTLACLPAGAQTPAAPAAARPVGSFQADRIDDAPLPVTDRVTDDDGTTYLVEFDRLILSLRPDNRFRASVRYRRTLYSRDPRGRDRAAAVQTLSVGGTYLIANGEIRFTPDSTKESRGLQMLAGRVETARRISVPFDYRNGNVERRRTLRLVRQDNIL